VSDEAKARLGRALERAFPLGTRAIAEIIDESKRAGDDVEELTARLDLLHERLTPDMVAVAGGFHYPRVFLHPVPDDLGKPCDEPANPSWDQSDKDQEPGGHAQSCDSFTKSSVGDEE
jgi:hypothetical protein